MSSMFEVNDTLPNTHGVDLIEPLVKTKSNLA